MRTFLTRLGIYFSTLILAGTVGYRAGEYRTNEEYKRSPITINELPLGQFTLDTYSEQQILQPIDTEYQASETSKEKGSNDTDTISTSSYSSDIVVIASKSGEKYYFPWCSGLSKVKEDNRIYFKNEEEAQSAGLELATNCE